MAYARIVTDAPKSISISNIRKGQFAQMADSGAIVFANADGAASYLSGAGAVRQDSKVIVLHSGTEIRITV